METPKTQSRKELVNRVFDLMNDNFTSSEFLREMIAAGADPNRMYLYNYLDFLKEKCERESKKTWTKKNPTYSATVSVNPDGSTGLATTIPDAPLLNVSGAARPHIQLSPYPHPQISSDLKSPGYYMIKSLTSEGLEQEAIDFLKAKGYKILKTTTVEL